MISVLAIFDVQQWVAEPKLSRHRLEMPQNDEKHKSGVKQWASFEADISCSPREIVYIRILYIYIGKRFTQPDARSTLAKCVPGCQIMPCDSHRERMRLFLRATDAFWSMARPHNEVGVAFVFYTYSYIRIGRTSKRLMQASTLVNK